MWWRSSAQLGEEANCIARGHYCCMNGALFMITGNLSRGTWNFRGFSPLNIHAYTLRVKGNFALPTLYNVVWTEWNGLIHCNINWGKMCISKEKKKVTISFVVIKVIIFQIYFQFSNFSKCKKRQLKTHRFAPLHLEGETCWHDLIQLPSHSVGEAMQGGIIMEGSFGWVVVGDHKALLTGRFVSPHTCVAYRTAVLFRTHLERINAE